MEDPAFNPVKSEKFVCVGGDFPYPDRPIRVFIEHKQVTAMIETPYKPLIDFALLCPYIKDDSGITLWLKEFANEHFTEQQVKDALNIFEADITERKLKNDSYPVSKRYPALTIYR
jgi:hypothetical protein